MAYSARLLSTNALQNPVRQVSHGFTEGDILGFDGANFFLADSSTAVNAEVVGMVSAIADVDHFWICQTGFLSDLPGPFVPGTLYYLSTAPGSGALTSTKPTNVGEVVVPLFIAYTATSGYFFVNPGDEITPTGVTPWQTINANQAMVVNKGYWINSGAPLTLTMPVSMGTSDYIEIACPAGGGGFIIDFGVGQVCDFVNAQTSSGGTITLTTTLGVMGGSIKINCHTADTGFMITASTGNFIVA